MEMKNTPNKKRSKLSRLIQAPFKLLTKARDFYVNSMNEYSDRIVYASFMGCPTGQVANSLPKSYSVNSSKSSKNDEDYRELLRAASARGLSNRIQLDQLQRQQSTNCRPNNINNHLPRSLSVGIGRIDEDKPCDFEDEIKLKNDAFPRSRSYAVGSRRTAYGVF